MVLSDGERGHPSHPEKASWALLASSHKDRATKDRDSAKTIVPLWCPLYFSNYMFFENWYAPVFFFVFFLKVLLQSSPGPAWLQVFIPVQAQYHL